MSPPTPPRLAADRVSVLAGGRAILREVSLALEAGVALAVLGPSGAGKSTLFRALVGEAPPTDGRIFADGEDVTQEPLWQKARRGIGYVPQGPSVLWDLKVADNVETFVALAWKRAGVSPPSAAELLDRVDLSGRRQVRAGDLSGGERRRLELARALALGPRVLVCDEPFAGVDPKAAAHLGALLRGLADEGVAVALADHHVAEALAVAHRAVLLLDGAVAVDAAPEAFAADPLVRGRYLGTLGPLGDDVSGAVRGSP